MGSLADRLGKGRPKGPQPPLRLLRVHGHDLGRSRSAGVSGRWDAGEAETPKTPKQLGLFTDRVSDFYRPVALKHQIEQ